MVADHHGGRDQGGVSRGDVRQVVAGGDEGAHHPGGGCTLNKQTPRPAAVASPMGHNRPPVPFRGQSGRFFVHGKAKDCRGRSGWGIVACACPEIDGHLKSAPMAAAPRPCRMAAATYLRCESARICTARIRGPILASGKLGAGRLTSINELRASAR
jgi:hypothetical protein